MDARNSGTRFKALPGDPRLAARLRKETQAAVLFSPGDRGRYSTDASIYQIEPIGVIAPRTMADVSAAMDIAREEGVPVLARGGGSSQSGQTVGEALVVDCSKYLTRVLDFDPGKRTIAVEPGIVLNQLNAFLRPHKVFFPVEPSTASRCTIGGMAANNSSGSRSLFYGKMVDNVTAIDALLADGESMRFADAPANLNGVEGSPRYLDLIQRVRAIAAREAGEIETRFPKVQRRVGGYNLDELLPTLPRHNMARLLVGSEGTLAFSTRIELTLQPLPSHRAMGVCQFPTFHDAMEATQHLVALGPTAVELVDRNIIVLGTEIPLFRNILGKIVRGEPDALLLVEFAGPDQSALREKVRELDQAMADLGFANAVVEAIDPAFQREIWEVREAALNIMMSMKGDAKPVSFIEDCAVPLEHLAEYTANLNEVFARHGTSGTWYAHASVGCLHVRPILNMKDGGDVRKMREIAEEAFAMVRAFKGAHSGEHGDGLVRSEFHESMFGPRLTRAFEEVKESFDPEWRMNPGKIVRPERMDDRSLFRFKPDYHGLPIDTVLDWSDHGSFLAAVEMCNNNGTCRKANPGVMCPSYRATGDEQHVTRGRANTLRLAITGQLGPDALTSDEMYETLDLCVSCKGCRRECPTGVDVAKMKIEFLYHYTRRHGVDAKGRLIAYLPRYAKWAAAVAPLMNLRDSVPGLAALTERTLGLSAKRSLPRWRADWRRPDRRRQPIIHDGRDVVLFVDTFNSYFEPENATAACRVLTAAGYHVHEPSPDGRPLCCGRTFLAAGLVDEARAEARRTLSTLRPYIEAGVPIVGLEPSCILSFRDEFKSILPGAETDAAAGQAVLFEEFLAAEAASGSLELALEPLAATRALLHGHCHQKAFAAMGAVEKTLRLVPELQVDTVDSSCCGMAGAFGYEAGRVETSMKMAELSLLPAVRAAPPDALIVADGTSCRHQIKDGASRGAMHVARVLERALAST